MAGNTAVGLLMEQMEERLRALVNSISEARRTTDKDGEILPEISRAIIVLLHVSAAGDDLNRTTEKLQAELIAATASKRAAKKT